MKSLSTTENKQWAKKQERLTIEQFRALAEKNSSTKSLCPAKNKYGAKRVGGHASKKEHNRANQLKLWQRAGIISNLREQVPYELIPAQYAELCDVDTGKSSRVCIERPCRYVADFVYDMDGQTIVEDTKGVKTKEYIIKRKLMLYLHGIRIKEV